MGQCAGHAGRKGQGSQQVRAPTSGRKMRYGSSQGNTPGRTLRAMPMSLAHWHGGLVASKTRDLNHAENVVHFFEPSSSHRVAFAGLVFLTASRIFLTEGLKIRNFFATSRPSTRTVSSPRFPFSTSTCTSGSCFTAAAKLAARARVPPQLGHCRIVTFFIIGLLQQAPWRMARLSVAGVSSALQ